MMTRKDYVALAAALQAARPYVMADRATVHAAYVAEVADVLAADNPRFDRAQFYAAAGVQS